KLRVVAHTHTRTGPRGMGDGSRHRATRSRRLGASGAHGTPVIDDTATRPPGDPARPPDVHAIQGGIVAHARRGVGQVLTRGLGAALAGALIVPLALTGSAQ